MSSISHTHLRKHLQIFFLFTGGREKEKLRKVKIFQCALFVHFTGLKEHSVNLRLRTEHLSCFPVHTAPTILGFQQQYTYVLLRVAFPPSWINLLRLLTRQTKAQHR